MSNEVLNAITHDLCQPLHCIQATADFLLMQRDLEQNEVEKYLINIRRSSVLAQEIVDDLSDSEALDRGQLILRPAEVLLPDVLKETVSSFQMLAQKRGAALSLRMPTSSGVVWMDRPRVMRVLNNLISNALKHLPRSEGEIVVTVHDFLDDEIVVEVSDNGRGIDAAHLPKIFEKFYQVRSEAVVVGRGLGLYLAKQIIAGHGGLIWARSGGVGQGTSVYFSLPKTRTDGARRLARPAGTEE